MIKCSIIKAVVVFLSILGTPFLLAWVVSFAWAQVTTEQQDQAPKTNVLDQAPPSITQNAQPAHEKPAKMPLRVGLVHKRLRHESFHSKNRFIAYPSIPPGTYSSEIVIKPPDELTPLMPAFWTGDLILPFTVPPQPPACELIRRRIERSPFPRGAQVQTTEGFPFECWQSWP